MKLLPTPRFTLAERNAIGVRAWQPKFSVLEVTCSFLQLSVDQWILEQVLAMLPLISKLKDGLDRTSTSLVLPQSLTSREKMVPGCKLIALTYVNFLSVATWSL